MDVESIENCDIFTVGWAKRAKHGERYGANYVEKFRSNIEAIYNVGKKSKEKKYLTKECLN